MISGRGFKVNPPINHSTRKDSLLMDNAIALGGAAAVLVLCCTMAGLYTTRALIRRWQAIALGRRWRTTRPRFDAVVVFPMWAALSVLYAAAAAAGGAWVLGVIA